MTYFLCFIVFLAAALVQSFSGFGFGIFAMSFLPYFMPSYGLSVALVNIATVASSVPVALQRRKRFCFRLVWPLLVGYVVSNTLAVYFAYKQPESLLFHLLGILLILLSVYFAFFGKRLRIRATPVTGMLAGLCSGVMSGLFAMGGPPVVLYFLSATEDETQYLACSLAYFAVVNAYTLLLRFLNGGITVQVLPYLLVIAAASLVNALISRRLGGRIGGDAIRKTVYVIMAASGVMMLFK